MRRAGLIPTLLWLAALLAPAACATHPAAGTGGATFVVVRHAEKATDDARDPGLSAAGQARASALARGLAATPLAAAYATQYKRTQQTAMLAAGASGIAITSYEASQSVGDFVARLRRAHAQGTVLVVGHSNTVPGIVAALCACSVAPLDEGVYDRWYEIRIDAAGQAALTQRTY
jgi:broad specificity phosphatase PhoE